MNTIWVLTRENTEYVPTPNRLVAWWLKKPDPAVVRNAVVGDDNWINDVSLAELMTVGHTRTNYTGYRLREIKEELLK